jgi:hypothetical protein
MIYSTNQSHHWKLNQLEVAISGRLANQIERIEPKITVKKVPGKKYGKKSTKKRYVKKKE